MSDSKTSPTPPNSFDEIFALIEQLPGADMEALTKVVEREGQLTKPAGALARLESLTEWMAQWQAKYPPTLNHPRTVVFAGNHGVAAKGVSAFPPEVTVQMVANFRNGGAAINQLVGQIDGDLMVHEMDLDNPTADMSEGPAMSEADCVKAMAYGMMCVEPGVDLLCLGEMGIANSTAAAALCHAMFGGKPSDWTGPGTGVEGDALTNKARIVGQAVEVNQGAMTSPLDILRCVGGLELAAITGAVLAARLARVPVMLDGYACTAAASVLHAIDPGLLAHCQVGHLSAEPAHQRLCQEIGKVPLLALGMRLGEGTGATLAANLVRGAILCHTGMATFAEAAVSGKDD